MRKFFSILLLAIFYKCAFLHSVSITPQPVNRENKIEAEVSKTVILAFNFNNDFLNELPDQLLSQCPNGKITGLVTKYEHYSYFLWYVMKVKSSGYCIK